MELINPLYNEALTNEIDREREEDFQQQQLKEQQAAEQMLSLRLQQRNNKQLKKRDKLKVSMM